MFMHVPLSLLWIEPISHDYPSFSFAQICKFYYFYSYLVCFEPIDDGWYPHRLRIGYHRPLPASKAMYLNVFISLSFCKEKWLTRRLGLKLKQIFQPTCDKWHFWHQLSFLPIWFLSTPFFCDWLFAAYVCTFLHVAGWIYSGRKATTRSWSLPLHRPIQLLLDYNSSHASLFVISLCTYL
jgi:hypothetical protein